MLIKWILNIINDVKIYVIKFIIVLFSIGFIYEGGVQNGKLIEIQKQFPSISVDEMSVHLTNTQAWILWLNHLPIIKKFIFSINKFSCYIGLSNEIIIFFIFISFIICIFFVWKYLINKFGFKSKQEEEIQSQSQLFSNPDDISLYQELNNLFRNEIKAREDIIKSLELKIKNIIEETTNKYEITLKDKDKIINDFQEQIVALTKVNDDNNKLIKGLKTETIDLKLSCVELQFNNKLLIEQNEENIKKQEHKYLNNQYEDLKNQYKNLTKQHKDINDLYEDLRKQHSNLNDKYDNLKKQNDDLNIKHENLTIQNENLTIEFENLKKKHELLTTEYYTNNSRYQQILVEQIEIVKKHNEEDLNEKTENFTKQMENLNKQLMDLKNSYEDLKNQHEIVKKHNEYLSLEFENLKKRHELLVIEYNTNAYKHYHTIEEEIKIVKKQHEEDLNAKIENLNKQHMRIVEKINDDNLKKQNVEDLNKNYKDLKELYSILDNQHDILKDKIHYMNIQKEEILKKQQEDFNDKNDANLRQLEKILSKRFKGDLDSQYEDFNIQLEYLVKQNDDLNDLYEDIKNQYEYLTLEYNDLKKEYYILKKQNDDLKKQYDDF